MDDGAERDVHQEVPTNGGTRSASGERDTGRAGNGKGKRTKSCLRARKDLKEAQHDYITVLNRPFVLQLRPIYSYAYGVACGTLRDRLQGAKPHI